MTNWWLMGTYLGFYKLHFYLFSGYYIWTGMTSKFWSPERLQNNEMVVQVWLSTLNRNILNNCMYHHNRCSYAISWWLASLFCGSYWVNQAFAVSSQACWSRLSFLKSYPIFEWTTVPCHWTSWTSWTSSSSTISTSSSSHSITPYFFAGKQGHSNG